MSFDQSSIARVNPPRVRGGDLHLSWESTATVGTRYQVYAGRKLAWSGTQTRATIPVPSGQVRIDVGTVGVGETTKDFSASLPPPSASRVTLNWQGGAFLDPNGLGDIAGFHVYVSSSPAGWGSGGYGQGGYGEGLPTIALSAPTATIPAYSGGVNTSGYGMGGYGRGGWGFAGPTSAPAWGVGGYGEDAYGGDAAGYSWKSGVLWSGLWGFAVAAYNAAGDAGAIQMSYASIQAPPRTPGASQAAPRLSCQLLGWSAGGYGAGGYGLPYVALTWLPSPG